MIKINKGPKPQILEDNEEQWKKDLLAAIAVYKLDKKKAVPESVKTRYRHEEIKTAIIAEAHGKCAYCESKILHDQPGHTEHIIAISSNPNHAFDWSNLVLGCQSCNTAKGTHKHDKEPIVDPTKDNPIEHFVFLGPFLKPRPGDEKACLTENLLALNRLELVERRKEKLDAIANLAHRWASKKHGSKHRRILELQLKNMAESDQEYAYMTACVLVGLCQLRCSHSPDQSA